MISFESCVSQYWWIILLRGIAAILFGVAALFAPGITLAVLVLLFGAYALVDGFGAIILGIREYGDRELWWATLIGGIVTALAVHVELFPTHIAGLPIAVNLGCHSMRRATVSL